MPLVLRTISLSLSYFGCLRLHTLLLTLSYTTLLVTFVCDQNPFYLFLSIIHTTLITPVLLNLPT
jgi:hypothetical protein